MLPTVTSRARQRHQGCSHSHTGTDTKCLITSEEGNPMKSLSMSLFVGVSALLSIAANADTYLGISNTQKLVTTSEPFNQAAELQLGKQVGAGGGQVLSVGGNAVYAFQQNADGAWAQTAKLTAFDSGVLTGPIAFDGTYALIRGYM